MQVLYTNNVYLCNFPYSPFRSLPAYPEAVSFPVAPEATSLKLAI